MSELDDLRAAWEFAQSRIVISDHAGQHNSQIEYVRASEKFIAALTARNATLERVLADVDAWRAAPMVLTGDAPRSVGDRGVYWAEPNFVALDEVLAGAKETT